MILYFRKAWVIDKNGKRKVHKRRLTKLYKNLREKGYKPRSILRQAEAEGIGRVMLDIVRKIG